MNPINLSSNLTLNKVYDVIRLYYYNSSGFLVDHVTDDINYGIINDNLREYRYSSDRFITLEESRNNKLKEVLE